MSAIAFPSLIVIFNYASNYYQVLDCYGSTIGSVHLEKPDLPVPGDDIHFFNRILRAGLITACRAENGCGSIRARVPGKSRLVRVKIFREIIGRRFEKNLRRNSGKTREKLFWIRLFWRCQKIWRRSNEDRAHQRLRSCAGWEVVEYSHSGNSPPLQSLYRALTIRYRPCQSGRVTPLPQFCM